MMQKTIEKVWLIKGLLFKNADYQLALDLEDSNNRVSLRYIITDSDSPHYTDGMTIGYKKQDFKLYMTLSDAKNQLYALA